MQKCWITNEKWLNVDWVLFYFWFFFSFYSIESPNKTNRRIKHIVYKYAQTGVRPLNYRENKTKMYWKAYARLEWKNICMPTIDFEREKMPWIWVPVHMYC